MPKRQSGNKKGKQSNFAKLSIFQPNKYKFKKSVKLALDSIHDIIAKINTELLDIKKECEYHETKYLYTEICSQIDSTFG